MVSSASERHRLFVHLQQLLGEEDAAVLMDHLPEGGWSKVATRSDLAELRADLRVEMADLRSEVRLTLANTMRQTLLATLTMNVALVAAVAGLVAAA